MRLKILLYTLFILTFFSFTQKKTFACCEGMCGTTDTCTYYNYFQESAWFPNCGEGKQIVITCTEDTDGTTQNYDANNPYGWNPEGYSGTTCDYGCALGGNGTGSSGYVEETKEIYCGDCAGTSTGTGGGGGGGGGGDPEPTAEPTGPVYVSGSVQTDVNAALSGAYCNQASNSPLSLTGININANNIANNFNVVPSGGSWSINTTNSGSNYTVTLDLTAQTGGTNYVCSCPAPIDPSNPYVCRYTGVGSPTAGVNFYLKEYNLSNDSWFQIFGGNLFSLGSVASDVPYDFCEADGSCQAALLVPPVGSSNQLASGFAIASTGNTNNLRSSDSSSSYHAYFHLIDRLNNVNSYGVNTSLNQLNYDYFYKLAENSLQAIGTGEDLEPLLADWTGAAWWQTDEINYIAVDGNVSIDESQGFNLTTGQKLVVFVDGNLTIDDSNPNDANRKITSVDGTSFLAFIVKGNILVTPHVGYELNPSVPTVPAVSVANSNVEGVFVADGAFTVQSKTAIGEVPPDKKFIGAGTFVGWSGINLNRTFNDNSFGPILNNNQAIENFIYRPDLLANWPTKLKTSVSNWREVDPQLITQ